MFMDRDEKDNISQFTGCTATVVLITRDTIYCANAGDSRTVLVRNNTVEALSEDHKPDSWAEK